MERMYSTGGWQSLPADLRFAVYSIVVAHGGAEGFEAVFNVFKNAEMAEERVRALRGLGYTKDNALIDRLLGMTLDDTVRAQVCVRVCVCVPVCVCACVNVYILTAVYVFNNLPFF